MIDKDYKSTVEFTVANITHFAYISKYKQYPVYERYHAWLQVLGLIETWDIVK